jgi:hypothetical protein
MGEDVEYVRLEPAQIDDQAIAEIGRLAPYVRSPGPAIPIESLIDLILSGRAVVARRSCGMSPEIIGFAVLADLGGEASRRVLALDPRIGGPVVEGGLRRALRAQQARTFLFRPHHRPPLGLSQALN